MITGMIPPSGGNETNQLQSRHVSGPLRRSWPKTWIWNSSPAALSAGRDMFFFWFRAGTLQGANISHLGKRKIIDSKVLTGRGYVSFRECNGELVVWGLVVWIPGINHQFWGSMVFSVIFGGVFVYQKWGAGILRPSSTQPMGNVFTLLGMTKIYTLEK